MVKAGIKNLLKATAAGLLIVLYAFSALQLNSLHGLFHVEPSSAQHTEQNEKDPCHRSIYHDDTKEGCRHNSHFITSLKCSVCSSTPGKEQFFSFHEFDGLGVVHDTYFHVDVFSVSIGTQVLLPSRAPPHRA